MVKMVTVMPLTVIIMLPLEFCVLAPLGDYLGQLLSSVILGIPTLLGPVGIAIIAALYMILVMFGMRLPVIMAVAVTYFATGYDDTILLCSIFACAAVLGIFLGVAFRAKQAETRELALGCATSNLLGGVSEPAIYGLIQVRRAGLL